MSNYTRVAEHFSPGPCRSSLLAAGETVLFNGLVDKSALRRRASRLLAIAGAPRRKTRELVLTDRRLVCRKHKPGRPHQVSNELTLRPAEREKDSKTTVVAVEPKGEREFVVMTVRAASCFPPVLIGTHGSLLCGAYSHRARSRTRTSPQARRSRRPGSARSARLSRQPRLTRSRPAPSKVRNRHPPRLYGRDPRLASPSLYFHRLKLTLSRCIICNFFRTYQPRTDSIG